jgi:transposase
MMTKNQFNEREQLEMLAIDQLVPQDHLVRKIESAIDFSFIYPLVKDLYSDLGRPSIDPVVLFKMVFIQYIFGIRSMRQTIKEIETNVAYRWFLGFGFYTEVPHFSTFGKNYKRRYLESDVFEDIFYHILKKIMDAGLLSADHVFVDSTHVKASANKH